jgi:hypothetical protein
MKKRTKKILKVITTILAMFFSALAENKFKIVHNVTNHVETVNHENK